MKFSTYTWQLYKQSDQGKAAIAAFMPECEDDCYNVFIKYNPGFTGDKDTYTDYSKPPMYGRQIGKSIHWKMQKMRLHLL